jgi:hypothetical protein
MKLKLDENLPESLVQALSALGHDVDNVRAENLVGQSDPDIWKAAQNSGRSSLLRTCRLRVPGRLALSARIGAAFQVEDAPSWARCFVLLTDHKLRVHRPAS